MKLPKRLHLLYELAEGAFLWDIGCDHSILAQINLKEKKFSTVYCVDKSINSLEKITSSKKAKDSGSIVLIHSDGCDLNWEKVQGTVVIAGVGGNTVLKILESCPTEKRYQLVWVMNPFTSIDKFIENSKSLLDGAEFEKTEVSENGRIRTVFKWKRLKSN